MKHFHAVNWVIVSFCKEFHISRTLKVWRHFRIYRFDNTNTCTQRREKKEWKKTTKSNQPHNSRRYLFEILLRHSRAKQITFLFARALALIADGGFWVNGKKWFCLLSHPFSKYQQHRHFSVIAESVAMSTRCKSTTWPLYVIPDNNDKMLCSGLGIRCVRFYVLMNNT